MEIFQIFSTIILLSMAIFFLYLAINGCIKGKVLFYTSGLYDNDRCYSRYIHKNEDFWKYWSAIAGYFIGGIFSIVLLIIENIDFLENHFLSKYIRAINWSNYGIIYNYSLALLTSLIGLGFILYTVIGMKKGKLHYSQRRIYGFIPINRFGNKLKAYCKKDSPADFWVLAVFYFFSGLFFIGITLMLLSK